MSYQIYHNDNLVELVYTIDQIESYFKTHHKDIVGFKKRTIAKEIKDGEMNKKGFRIVKSDTRKTRRPDEFKFNSKIERLPNGAIRAHDIEYKNTVSLNEGNKYFFIEQILSIIKKKGTNYKRTLFRVVFFDNENNTTFGTTYLDFNQLMDQIDDLISQLLMNYEQINITDVKIERFVVNKNLGDITVFRSSQKMSKTINSVDDFEKLFIGFEFSKNSYSRMLKLLKGKFLFSPLSSKACMIKACMMAKFKNLTKEKLDMKAKNWISDHQEKITEFSPNCVMPLLSRTLKTKIHVHYCKYDVEDYLYDFTKSKDIIHILIRQQHAIAIMDDEVNWGDEVTPNNKPDKNKYLTDFKIEKKEYIDKKEDYHIATYDFETCDKLNEKLKKNETIAYAVGYYDGKIYKEFYKKNEHENLVQRFISYLFYDYNEHEKIILYAHNGGKFDIFLILEELINRRGVRIVNLLDQSGRLTNVECTFKNKTIIFRDSYTFISSSLDAACKSYKPKSVKLTGDVDHDKININNCWTKEIYEYTRHYLKNDCVCLYEILEIFDKTVNDRFNFSIKEVLTNASIARRYFMSKYYDEDNYPIHNLEYSVDKELRNYYYGGRNECMTKLGLTEGKKLFYIDFTSLYPSVMESCEYQYGNVVVLEVDTDEFDPDWFGFCKVKFRNTHKNSIPLHAVVMNGKLIFPHADNWTDSIISTEEIRYAIFNDTGYEYKFEKVYNYEKKAPLFKDMINDMYKWKIEAQESGKEAERATAKIVLNSSYGFWGMRYLERTQYLLDEPFKYGKNKLTEDKRASKLVGYLMEQKLTDYKQFENYDLFTVKDKIDPNCVNVGLASMITSNARLLLHELMTDIKEREGKIYYLDTDSVVCDYNIYEDEIMKKKWVGTGGKKLGELTNETDQEGGYYNKIITLGNKMYALENKKLKKEKLQQVLKLKGLNSKAKYLTKKIDKKNKLIILEGLSFLEGTEKLTFEDYLLISKGYNLICDNMTFLSGINYILNKNKTLTKISNTKQIRRLYDKANVDENNNISPFII